MRPLLRCVRGHTVSPSLEPSVPGLLVCTVRCTVVMADAQGVKSVVGKSVVQLSRSKPNITNTITPDEVPTFCPPSIQYPHSGGVGLKAHQGGYAHISYVALAMYSSNVPAHYLHMHGAECLSYPWVPYPEFQSLGPLSGYSCIVPPEFGHGALRASLSPSHLSAGSRGERRTPAPRAIRTGAGAWSLLLFSLPCFACP